MKKNKKPMEHFNIAEFNRGQGSKIIRHTSEDDSVAFIQKNGKPLAILISNERYERLLAGGIDINDFWYFNNIIQLDEISTCAIAQVADGDGLVKSDLIIDY